MDSVKKTTKELRQDTKLVSLLRRAVITAQDDDGWSNLAVVGVHVSNQASFDSRNYGYAKLSSLMEATELFEMQRRQNGIYVKDKREVKVTKV